MQHIQTPEALRRAGDELLDGSDICGVELIADRSLAKFGGQGVRSFAVDVGNHRSRTLGDQAATGCLADPRSAACDDRDLTQESVGMGWVF